MKPGKIKIVTLLVTRACNLNCQYCYVSDRNEHNMSFETAKQVIDDAFEENKNSFDFLEITFLGGEPLMAFDLIKQTSEWVWSKKWNKPYIFSAVTNGTVCNKAMKEWFLSNKDKFRLCLSYDGSIEAQNINRSNSDSRIDLDYFACNWPSQPLKMTISEDTVHFLAHNIIELQKKGVLVNCSFAGGVPLWKEETLKALKSQMELLSDYYSKHLDLQPTNLLDIDLMPVSYREDYVKNGCGIGRSRITYDYDGQKYPCHLISPLVIDTSKLREFEKYDLFNCSYVEIPACRDCILDNICPTCPRNSLRLFGNPYQREKNLCSIFKIQVQYACRYQAKRILNKSLISDSDKKLLRAIAYILDGEFKES
jgi:uncharacterized protein